jgi:hypothetical protein
MKYQKNGKFHLLCTNWIMIVIVSYCNVLHACYCTSHAAAKHSRRIVVTLNAKCVKGKGKVHPSAGTEAL